MNVYEWLESPDVREYLEGIHYEFTLPEAFYVELLNVMPDCPFSIESDAGGKVETASLHKSIREFIGQQRELLEVVCRKDETGVYSVILGGVHKEGKGVALSEFLDKNWEKFEGKGTLRLTKTWSGKQRHNGILFFCVNAEKQAPAVALVAVAHTVPSRRYFGPRGWHSRCAGFYSKLEQGRTVGKRLEPSTV